MSLPTIAVGLTGLAALGGLARLFGDWRVGPIQPEPDSPPVAVTVTVVHEITRSTR